MNKQLFDYANRQYQLRDYPTALIAFTECLQDASAPLAPGETGLLYHQIGNCLIKLNNPTEAIQAYTQASADPQYAAISTVECNLGMAYASLRDYEHAVRCFRLSVEEGGNETPYKAYMGMGNALMKLGKTAEAGVAFREASLDEAKPDVTKALLNLGLCFMALDRPLDAVASYESALPFEMKPATKNKLYANLGQAYVAAGKMTEAVGAFEEALRDKTYFLSDAASVDYQRAIGVVAQGQADATQMLPVADVSGLDVAADGMPIGDGFAGAQDPFYYDDLPQDENFPGYLGMYDNATDGQDHFFNSTDKEIEQWSKGIAKKDRKRRNVGLKIAVAFIVVVILAAAALVFAYTQGYGYPTQEMVAKELFADPSAAADSLFSGATSPENAKTMTEFVAADPDARVDGVNRSMTESEVFVTATTDEGGQVTYRVSMVRDLASWKISNVELYFASQS